MPSPSAGSSRYIFRVQSLLPSVTEIAGGEHVARVISENFRSELRRDRIQQPLLRIPRVANVAGDGMMPAATGNRVRRTSAALRGVTRVARLAKSDAASQGPVAQQTGHQERQKAQAGPSGSFAVTGTGARLVGAARRHLVVDATGDATAVTAIHAMIEESLDAAQARRVVQNRLGRAQALVIADPLAGQRRWFPT